MIRHPYTLYHCAAELHAKVKGMRVHETYLHDDDTLVICCEGGEDEGSDYDIEVHIKEPVVAMVGMEHRGRPRHHTRDVFPLLRGDTIRTVHRPFEDRCVHIVTNRQTVVVQLYSGGRANVLCINAESVVVDSIKHRQTLYGSSFDVEQVVHGTRNDTHVTLQDVISFGYLHGSKEYAIETCHRCDVNPHTPWNGVSEDNRRRITAAAVVLRQELMDHPMPCVLRSTEGRTVFSLIPLQGYDVIEDAKGSGNGSPSMKTPAVPAADHKVTGTLVRVLRMLLRDRAYHELYRSCSHYVTREMKRLEKACTELRTYVSTKEHGSALRYKGDLLLSRPDVRTKGLSILTMQGWSGEEVEIPLDPLRTVAENAQEYYERARRVVRSAQKAAERLPGLEQRRETMLRVHTELSLCTSVHEVRELIKKENVRMDNDGKVSPEKKSDGRSKGSYREFELGEGWTLYVGRSAQNNDELTMKFAKQKDYWLHARGVSGSHAVLRSGRDTAPPKNILEAAAEIAAYYSKARNAKHVPVVYTRRSYVRKPKGAAVGAVTLEREDTIMVTPRAPSGADD